MKKQVRIAIFLIIFLISSALFANIAPKVKAEASSSPAARYVEIVDLQVNVNLIEFTVSWATNDDPIEKYRFCNLIIWLMKDSGIHIASWGIRLFRHGYSGGLDNDGIHTWIGTQHHIMAEFPYKVEVRTHPIDGTQTYYFFKSHIIVYPEVEIYSGDIIQVAGIYDDDPPLINSPGHKFPEYYDGALPYYGPQNKCSYSRIVMQESFSPVPPYIESTDSNGVEKNAFKISEDVYMVAYGFRNGEYPTYIIEDVTWTDGMTIGPPDTSIISGPSYYYVDIPFSIEIPRVIWSSPLTPGNYDIIVDINDDGIYDAELDVLDDNEINVAHEREPSVRYVEIIDMQESGNQIEFTVSWAVHYVVAWGDRCNFRIWAMKDSGIVLAAWGVGLSDTLRGGDYPGYGIMGIYGGDGVSAWEGSINTPTHYTTAPYMVEDRNHPIDGIQTYYFYKQYVTVIPLVSLESGDIIQIAGVYESDPPPSHPMDAHLFPEYYDGPLPYYGFQYKGSYSRMLADLAPTAEFSWSPEPQEEGSPVQFTDESTSSPDDIVGWSWDFSGLGTSTDQDPSFTFMDDGVYTVTLTVTDDDGLTDSASHDVTINDLGPTVDFSWSPEPQEEGSPVQFTDESTSSPDDIVGWSWDFSGLGTSTDKDPEFTFTDDGVYTVTLTVIDDDGSTDTVSHRVTVDNVAPSTDAGHDQTVNEGDTVLFSGGFTDPGADTWVVEWDFGDGDVAYDTLTPNHAYGDNGVYVVALTVTDDEGDWATDTLTVTVTNVTPSITPYGPYTVDEGLPLTLTTTATDLGSDDLTFTWSWGYSTPDTTTTYYNDGGGPDPYPSPWGTYPFSATDTAMHTYGDNGVFTVTLTVIDDDGGTTVYTTTITVNNFAPTISSIDMASPNPDNPEFILPNVHEPLFTGTATDLGSDDLTFTWDWNDGSDDMSVYFNDGVGPDPHPSPWGSYPFSATNEQGHVFSEPGTYTVTLTVEDDDAGVDSETYEIKILSAEEAKHVINDYIQSLPDGAFDKNPEMRKKALDRMFSTIDKMLENQKYEMAIRNLKYVREKADGLVDGKPNNDLIIDEDAQWHICMKIDDLIAYLETLV